MLCAMGEGVGGYSEPESTRGCYENAGMTMWVVGPSSYGGGALCVACLGNVAIV